MIVAAGATPLALEDVCGIDNPKVVLAEQGKRVVFAEALDTFMNNITFDEKQVYESRFKDPDVQIRTGQRLEAVTEAGITVIDRYGRRTEIAADSVVLASGFRSDRRLIDGLCGVPGLRVLDAGDCVQPRKIVDAIQEGHLAAKLLD